MQLLNKKKELNAKKDSTKGEYFYLKKVEHNTKVLLVFFIHKESFGRGI